jgi:hypothetical protein
VQQTEEPLHATLRTAIVLATLLAPAAQASELVVVAGERVQIVTSSE